MQALGGQQVGLREKLASDKDIVKIKLGSICHHLLMVIHRLMYFLEASGMAVGDASNNAAGHSPARQCHCAVIFNGTFAPVLCLGWLG